MSAPLPVGPERLKRLRQWRRDMKRDACMARQAGSTSARLSIASLRAADLLAIIQRYEHLESQIQGAASGEARA